MKYANLIFFSLFCFCLCGQQTNPFDIPPKGERAILQSSADLTEDSLTTGNVESQSQNSTANPFEIQTGSSRKMEASPIEPSKSSTPSFLRGKDSSIIVLVYSVVMLIILTLAISMDRKRFGSLLKSTVNSNYLKTLYRDTKAWSNGQFIILYVFFTLNMGFVLWLAAMKLDIHPLFHLFVLVACVGLCYLVRHIVMWMISVIFPVGNDVILHNYSIALHNAVLGTLLLPFIMALEFMPGLSIQTTVIGLLSIIGLLYLFRQVKGLLMVVSMRGFNPFYFFIYLCAIEIAPILVAYKMMSGAL